MNQETLANTARDTIETRMERHKTYGDSPERFGLVMEALDLQPKTIGWEEFGLLVQMVSKLVRYRNIVSNTRGDSDDAYDSLKDLTNYSLMLASLYNIPGADYEL